ncbi:olfactory receptor 1571-like [Erpetoichthys calabaricus]|uniref:olfactory receptor 1571-like n=1 Tax=Erpetoichthys calabaricus TaxID=27687 RepID=UPI002234D8CC|nr:olfactory receptor 1571-like [Erpetoichthys calabaricus]
MNSQQPAAPTGQNMTFVRPLGFYIGGFQSLPYSHYYFIFLGVVYIATLIANFLLMVIILTSECLHTPKYIAIFSLSVVDVSYSTAIIPRSVDAFLFNSKFIFYETCLVQMFFVHYFCAMESLSLTILAYERLISICAPFQSSIINTNSRMISIISITWFVIFLIILVMVSLITRLSFCRSLVIKSYFCDHGPVFSLACNDFTPNWMVAYFCIVSFFCLPLTFIIISYICIIFCVLKIRSLEGRQKAFKTCTTHLTLVAIFYIPLLVIYITAWVRSTVDADTRILNTSLAATIPPLLNPIIYTLKTEEILVQVKATFRKKTLQFLK